MDKYIVIHHSASPDGRTNDWKGICRFHTSWRRMDRGEIITQDQATGLIKQGVKVIGPWRGPCGYHRGIENVNGEAVVQLGRELWDAGAHCEGFNYRSIGICIVGNYDHQAPPAFIWLAALHEVRNVAATLRLDLGKLVQKKLIIGHRESYPLVGKAVQKTCPGTAFDMDRFRAELI